MTWVTQMLADIQKHKTLKEIADELELSVRMVTYLKATGHEPRWSTGHRLRELHAKLCQKNSLSVSGASGGTMP